MWLALFIACKGDGLFSDGRSPDDYAPPWPEHLVYRQVAPDEVGASIDTAEELDEIFHVLVTGESPTWTFEIRSGDNVLTAEPVETLTFTLQDGFGISAATSQTLSSPLLLLSSPFNYDEPIVSGDWTATPTIAEYATTWYGVFNDVVDVQVSGPINARFRLDKDMGPVQWIWGDLAGDLAWYE